LENKETDKILLDDKETDKIISDEEIIDIYDELPDNIQNEISDSKLVVSVEYNENIDNGETIFDSNIIQDLTQTFNTLDELEIRKKTSYR